MINWLVFSTFVASFTLTLMGLFVDLTYQMRYQPQLTSLHEQLIAELPHYLQSKDDFSKHPIFSPETHKTKDLTQFFQKNTPGLIDKKTKQAVLSKGKNWLDKVAVLPLPDNLLLFFKSLKEYDHIGVSLAQSIHASDFIVISQIYLSNAFHFAPIPLEQALNQVRQLSIMLLKSSHLAYKRAGLSLLSKERDLFEFIQSRRHVRQLRWTLIPEKQIKSFNDFLNNTAVFLSYLTPPQALEKIFLDNKLPSGFCAVFYEQKDILNWSQPFLMNHFPFEPNFQMTLSRIDKIAQKAKQYCPPQNPKLNVTASWVSHLPYYRRLLAVKILLNKSKQDHFR